MNSKVALVTGAAIRVGKALALGLAEQGYDIAVHYNGSQEDALQTAQELKLLGARVALLKADLSASETVSQLIGRARQELGPVSVLVNSAAIFPANDDLQNADKVNWELIMQLNLKAPLLLSKAFAQQCPEGSHIINIVDARQRRPAGDHLVYRLSKAGLWHLTESLAVELAPKVQVNGLALGAILPPPGADDLHFKRMCQQIPLARTGDPKAVSEAVKFLLSQSFITGAILPIDGGEFL